MYLNYAKLNQLTSELLLSSDGQIVLEISGKNVWDHFKDESGKHIIQRIPPTESKDKRQTSVVTVAVLPLPKNVQSLKMSDVKIKTQGGSGPGGQHQNKTECAVRVVHVPTGISVFINGRSQYDNKQKALEILNARVQEHFNSQEKEKYAQNRKNQREGGNRSGGIRTYNLIKNFIVNHKNDKKSFEVKKIMKGHLELIR